jgi:DMSO/TMAO reductase YedYZ molybdopterin-dependent catalytic subunit
MNSGNGNRGKERPRTTGRIRRFASDEEFERERKSRSRRAFLVGGLASIAGIGGWRWLTTRAEDDGVLWPFRRVLEGNERLAEGYFSNAHLARTYPVSMAAMPRVNGMLGIEKPLDPETWRLQVVGLAATPAVAALQARQAASPAGNADDGSDSTDAVDESDSTDEGDSTVTDDVEEKAEGATIELTMADIRALPRTELVTELRCIEGWNVVVHWAGVRFADFAARYLPATRSGKAPDLGHPEDLLPYVSIETPNGGYYVGLDTASVLHPQTLLCYEMDGKPLTPEHGAPLRLVVPVKYGVKNIKRIGTIRFTARRPDDYWAEQGYDWYAGL